MMDLRALQDRTFSLGCYFSFMAGVGIFATIYLTRCIWGVRGFSALEIGSRRYFPPVCSGHVYSVLFVARQPRRSALAADGRADRLCGVNVQLCSDHSRLGADQLLLPQAFRGLAQQFAVAPTVTLTLAACRPRA